MTYVPATLPAPGPLASSAPAFTALASGDPPARAAGPFVAVASGKGGVGKTWFSITLAHALARQGRRVLLFDGDLGLANADVQLGLAPHHDLGAVLAGRVALADAAVPVPDAGFDLLAGRSGSGALAGTDLAAVDAMLAGLRRLAGRYDTVVLDLGAGLDRGVRRMAAWADTLLVLATEEPTSLTDAYATLKLHAADRPATEGYDTRLVVNQVGSPAAGLRTYDALSRACTRFLHRTPALAGTVRRDDKVRDAIRRQTPLLTRYPASHAATDVEAVAARL